MPRSKASSNSNRKKVKLHQRAKGFWGSIKNKLRATREYVMRAMRYSYRDRKVRARDFRALWITRISAAVIPYNMNYSRFIYGLKKANVQINRKMLSELAIHHPNSFGKLVEMAQV